MMKSRVMKFSGLGVLVLTLLLVLSMPAQAAPLSQTVTVNLCASDGTITLPDSTVIPIWSFVDVGGGACGSGLATLPGATIRANAGDTIVINLANALSVPTSIVIPGQIVAASGGSQGTITLEAPAGGSATYTINGAVAGTYLYESGTNSDIQIAMGLTGPLIVDSASATYAGVDAEAVLVLSEIDPNLNANPGGFTFVDSVTGLHNYAPVYWLINGEAFPDTDPIAANEGDTLLIRYLSAGYDHPSMALLGAHQLIIARNGFELANPFNAVAEIVPAGQTVDALVSIPSGTAGSEIALYNRNTYLTNNGVGDGGMQTRIAVGSGGGNNPPVAQPNSATTSAGQSVTINVVNNDSDPDGDSLTVTGVTDPANGTAVNNGDGTITYTPDAGFGGTDMFDYTISDGNGGTDTATVTVNVDPPSTNTDPVAVDDSATTNEDQPVTIDVLANDSDADGDTLTVTGTSLPANGSVVNNGDGTVDYTPNSGFSGQDSFSYTINDGNGGTASATVTVDVIAAQTVSCPAGDYFTKQTNRSINGVQYRRHDIVHFNGSFFSMFFDGSNVGIPNNRNIDAFTFVSCDQILMSFNNGIVAGTLPGLPTDDVDDSDIVLFTATSYGEDTTSGTFGIAMKGADHGLTTNGEDIDALTILPGGELLISTNGTARVGSPEVLARDEDLLIFAPDTSGDYSSGSWLLHFDGSDVGLGESGGEDVNAVESLSVADLDLYLSTTGDFVTGVADNGTLSGADEDVFICSAAVTGDPTDCGQWFMHFDGDVKGVSTGDDITGYERVQ